MGKLYEEARLWNTPSVGAYLLWKFTSGYCDTHPTGDAPVALLHFIAMPILSSKRLLEPISNRRANLQSYVRSFESKQDTDVLFSIHDRIKRSLDYTMTAIDIAISTGLLFWDIESGKLYSRKEIKRPQKINALKTSFVRNGKKAEILGGWFSEHSISTVATYLKVVL
ncbi:MAG: hypothetical protein JXR46_06210 [Calditrichaceae bacterium]|nr:hypothetical protein [Calditrichaceae bacterium]MBN2708620.1 hypothetical protein [Calditrichaceae bacterium]RQV95470.1 MAG: hypothetical protein EH224_07570 [Calditrichota bacterium]